MALKDNVLNNYFKAPLSRRKKSLEESGQDGSIMPRKNRFFHDKENELLQVASEENKGSTSKIDENLKADLNDKLLTNDNISLIDDKNSDSLSKEYTKAPEKRNTGASRETKYNATVFFPTDPSALQELNILVKKTRGLQKNVLYYIVDRCRGSGSFDSGPIDLTDISSKYNSPVDLVRTAIKRLLAKNLIMKGKGKTGPTGYSIFYVASEVKEIILNIQK